tara:strand:- start:236 stop:364 length:129 start_codon:yes stop_codon:yes gene_type:complete
MKWLRIFMRRKKEHAHYSRGYVALKESLYAKAERMYAEREEE